MHIHIWLKFINYKCIRFLIFSLLFLILSLMSNDEQLDKNFSNLVYENFKYKYVFIGGKRRKNSRRN